jgi:hypothetical protein
MASADFCRPIDVPYDASSSRQTDRSPRVIHTTFLPYTRRIYSTTLPDDYWALIQILPRGRHPCRPANGSRHQGP